MGKIYNSGTPGAGTSIGRVDSEGRIYNSGSPGTGACIGRVDSEGRIYNSGTPGAGTSIGRVDSEGRIYNSGAPGTGACIGRIEGGILAGGAALLLFGLDKKETDSKPVLKSKIDYDEEDEEDEDEDEDEEDDDDNGYTDPLKQFQEAKERFEENESWIRKNAPGSNIDEELVNQGIQYMLKEEFEKSASFFLKAAEQGHMGAQYVLGEYYTDGRENIRSDGKKAVYWLTKAAKQGHAYAQNNLGALYYSGSLVSKNRTKAKYWFKKADKQDLIMASRNLYGSEKSFLDPVGIFFSIVGGIVLGSIMASLLGFFGFAGGAVAGWIVCGELRKRL